MTVIDDCGCPNIVLNESNPGAVEHAEATLSAWIDAGCAFGCGTPCFTPDGGACQPGPDGTSGVCVGLSLD